LPLATAGHVFMDTEKTGGISFSDILPFFKNRVIFNPVLGEQVTLSFSFMPKSKKHKNSFCSCSLQALTLIPWKS
jgi:hypothetical protein